jgi:ankyrin repeat protein
MNAIERSARLLTIINACNDYRIEREFPPTDPLRKERIARAYAERIDQALTLIEAGIDFNFRDSLGYCILGKAITKNTAPIAIAMIEAGADPNVKDAGDITPLMIAVKGNLQPIVNLLLANGADINATNYIGATPLLIACNYGTPEMALHLIDSGADTNVVGPLGISACTICTRKPTFTKKLSGAACKRGGSRVKTMRRARLNKRRQQGGGRR